MKAVYSPVVSSLVLIRETGSDTNTLLDNSINK